jgi:hypothetical protein
MLVDGSTNEERTMHDTVESRRDALDGIRAALDSLQFMAAGGIVGVALAGVSGLRGPLSHDLMAAAVGALIVFALRRNR